jgi:hypothetical protein
MIILGFYFDWHHKQLNSPTAPTPFIVKNVRRRNQPGFSLVHDSVKDSKNDLTAVTPELEALNLLNNMPDQGD